ncbi:hypothetical protein [Streptomyces sp. NPDC004721]
MTPSPAISTFRPACSISRTCPPFVLREQSGADVGDALYDNLRLGVRDVRAERPVGASAD